MSNKYGKNFSEKDKEEIKNFLLKDNFYELFRWSIYPSGNIDYFLLRDEIYKYDVFDNKDYFEYNNIIFRQLIKLYLFFQKYFNRKEIIEVAFSESNIPLFHFEDMKKHYIKEKRKEKELENLILQNIKN